MTFSVHPGSDENFHALQEETLFPQDFTERQWQMINCRKSGIGKRAGREKNERRG
jgi:hypothetical protein